MSRAHVIILCLAERESDSPDDDDCGCGSNKNQSTDKCTLWCLLPSSNHPHSAQHETHIPKLRRKGWGRKMPPTKKIKNKNRWTLERATNDTLESNAAASILFISLFPRGFQTVHRLAGQKREHFLCEWAKSKAECIKKMCRNVSSKRQNSYDSFISFCFVFFSTSVK